MQKTLTREFMSANKGCYSEEQLMDCSFIKSGKKITLQSILESEISLSDKFWFMCKIILTPEQNRALAVQTAEMVLSIYKEQYCIADAGSGFKDLLLMYLIDFTSELPEE